MNQCDKGGVETLKKVDSVKSHCLASSAPFRCRSLPITLAITVLAPSLRILVKKPVYNLHARLYSGFVSQTWCRLGSLLKAEDDL